MKVLLFVALLALTLLALTTSILADDDQEYTPPEIVRNEQRKKLGMPPMPPKGSKKKSVKSPSERARKVTGPLAGGLGMAPFKVSKQTAIGHIAIHKGNVNGAVLGFLDNHKIVKSAEQAPKYAYILTGPLSEIRVLVRMHRFHAMWRADGSVLGRARRVFVSKPGDRPLQDHKGATHFETSVFSIDPDTHEIDIQWVNPDGSLPPVHIVLMDERIFYVGDVMAFRDYTDAVVTPVTTFLNDSWALGLWR
ncbi:uncharacterized protein LACBIDRAFT_324860 [Laccaria bicolor S238N-H82]|uniref:Predicted protein n=1 Tax=Laccaria bicolor (strain S238N-H82 / ATCC MYA-4686) TaxID=486041 RepID=B0D3A2_LACBS|nr:uncharacterized protein LACBIDRAFT_324860 [Laccaria bicolor S238N-H82]EDR11246.1 predicted protein [Laccaria bicolor S238N-H82]|eukprot:XP_001878547.1 predicted protein [Laccaria bicolor S238N-H82]